MGRSIQRIAIILLIAAAGAALWWHLSRPEAVEVTVQAAARGRVEATVANTRAGTVKACRRARLAPTTGGQIAHLPVHEGETVQGGQLLLELWNDDLAAQLKLARSEAEAARASSEEACLMAAEARREARRQTRLLERKLTSEGEADRARTNAQASQASCRASKATAAVSRARIEVAQATLERTRLRAPFTGTIAEINGELGEFVTPSPTGVQTLPAVDLIDNSCLYISAPIDEIDAPSIKPGMDARISLDAFGKRRFPGIVQRIAPYVLEVEKQARTVEVEAVFANPEDFRRMLPGYSADVEVIIEVREDVLRIPTEAVLEGGRVLVYRETDGVLEERRIKAGLSNWRFTEIVSGLEAGDQVVTSVDREGVVAGAHARPQAEEAPTPP